MVQLHVDESTARRCIEAKRKRARIAIKGLDGNDRLQIAEGTVEAVREDTAYGDAKHYLVTLISDLRPWRTGASGF